MIDSGAVEGRRGRSGPCDGRAIVVQFQVQPRTLNLRVVEAGDRRIRHIERSARRIEPAGEFQLRSVGHGELASGSGNRQGEFQIRIDQGRVGRDDRIVKDKCATGVHVQGIARVGGVLRELQASVDQGEASAGVDVDRAVNGIEYPAANLGRCDRPVSGDDSNLVASARPRGGTQRDNRREDPDQGEGPNDQKTECLPIPSGSVRHPKTSQGRVSKNLRNTATGGHVTRAIPARFINRLPSDYLSRYGPVLAKKNNEFLWRKDFYLYSYMKIVENPRKSRKIRETRIVRPVRAMCVGRSPRSAQITFFFSTFFTLTGAFFAPLSSSPPKRWPHA